MREIEDIERIVPTKETLEEFFKLFPDHKQRYEFATNFLNKEMKVADCACGVGYGTYLLSKSVSEIRGFDISSEALEHAKTHFIQSNNEFLHVDNIKNDKYDFIISFETIEHMSELNGDEFLQNFRTSMKSNGKLLISTPINKTDKKHNVTPYHIREYDDMEFPEKLIKNGFKIIEMYGQGSDYHKKLYGSKNSSFSIFRIMKLGLHRVLPSRLRNILKSKILGNEGKGLVISAENWENSAVQIALCEIDNK